MESLKLSYDILSRNLSQYAKIFQVIETAEQMNDSLMIEMAQDATIRRFKYSADSFWKFLKRYLETYYELEKVNSPRAVFESCVKQRLCSEQQGEQLIAMLEDRNVTTHTYDVDKVRRIFPRVLNYHSLMKDIVDSLPNAPK